MNIILSYLRWLLITFKGLFYKSCFCSNTSDIYNNVKSESKLGFKLFKFKFKNYLHYYGLKDLSFLCVTCYLHVHLRDHPEMTSHTLWHPAPLITTLFSIWTSVLLSKIRHPFPMTIMSFPEDPKPFYFYYKIFFSGERLASTSSSQTHKRATDQSIKKE